MPVWLSLCRILQLRIRHTSKALSDAGSRATSPKRAIDLTSDVGYDYKTVRGISVEHMGIITCNGQHLLLKKFA